MIQEFITVVVVIAALTALLGGLPQTHIKTLRTKKHRNRKYKRMIARIDNAVWRNEVNPITGFTYKVTNLRLDRAEGEFIRNLLEKELEDAHIP